MPSNIAMPEAAAHAVLVDDRGWVLIVQRSYKKRWHLPGGFVHIGEAQGAPEGQVFLRCHTGQHRHAGLVGLTTFVKHRQHLIVRRGRRRSGLPNPRPSRTCKNSTVVART
jgi:NUDIX domain